MERLAEFRLGSQAGVLTKRKRRGQFYFAQQFGFVSRIERGHFCQEADLVAPRNSSVSSSILCKTEPCVFFEYSNTCIDIRSV